MNDIPLAIERTEAVAKFMQALFKHQLHETENQPKFPDHPRRVQLFSECSHAVKVLVSAFKYQRTVSWCTEDYVEHLSAKSTGRNEKVEEKLLRLFPPGPPAYELRPLIVKDSEDNILLWYLPNVLTRNRTDQVWRDLNKLEPSVQVIKGSTSWRVSPTHYRSEPGWAKAGNVSMAPAWFQQAHEKANPLEVSAPLVKKHTKAWLLAMEDAFTVVGGITSVIHPELFEVGCAALRRLEDKAAEVSKGQELPQILALWGVPFSVISAICNRTTPLHRDTGSAHAWFDVLLPVGNYIRGVAIFPGVGLELRYDPGTVIAHLGRILRHGADCDGDRACLAFYMRQSVLNELKLELPLSWPNTRTFTMDSE